MRIIIDGAGDLADALAQDLRRQVPEETGITVEVDPSGSDVVLGNLASQEVADGLAGSLNKGLPEGLRARVEATS
jgi:hypothetical protein